MPDRTPADRLEDFIRRLRVRKAASSELEALTLLSTTLNEVEDETAIPYDPATRGDDGRMYPPQEDARRPTDHPDVVRFRTRGHNIFVRRNGAIEIRRLKGDKLALDKPGADGRRVSDP